MGFYVLYENGEKSVDFSVCSNTKIDLNHKNAPFLKKFRKM